MGKDASADAKKGGKKKIVMILLPVLAAGGLAKMTALKGKSDATETAKAAEPKEGEIVEVGSLTVNLADADRHYARVGIALVLNATASTEEVSKKIPLLKDQAITKIGAHSSAELRTSAGQEALRKELMEAAKEVWKEEDPAAARAGDAVLRVALTELVVQ